MLATDRSLSARTGAHDPGADIQGLEFVALKPPADQSNTPEGGPAAEGAHR